MATNLMKYKGERLMRKTFVIMTALLAFLVSSQIAFAATKTRTALSPYVQTDKDSTYTFVGITHPSLNSASTEVGLTIATVGLDGTNPSSSFTVTAGQTYRVFIVATNHSTINSDTVTGNRIVFLGTTTGGANGQVRVTLSNVAPYSRAAIQTDLRGSAFSNLNQLSMWGAIVIPSTSTGFAMEFVGDAHDSAALLNSTDSPGGTGLIDSEASTSFATGRGIN